MVKEIENRNNIKIAWEKWTLQELHGFCKCDYKESQDNWEPFAMGGSVFLPTVNLYITIAYHQLYMLLDFGF